MKFIKPLVGISKIIENYDGVICGFNGVLSKGDNINLEALHALSKSAEMSKEIVILSNSSLRVREVVDIIETGSKEILKNIKAIITAGELLHYMLKNPDKMGLKGNIYYNLGANSAVSVFDGLDFAETKDMSKADFVFMGSVKDDSDTLEKYTDKLEYAASLGLDFLCVGNDVATYKNGEICLGSGAVAEQYALLGGRVITMGKPNKQMIDYAKECFSNKFANFIFIGDSFTTDMKSANVLAADMVLISKGIHVNFLGEGYIPDVEKTRNMAQDYEIYPDYVMSGLRW